MTSVRAPEMTVERTQMGNGLVVLLAEDHSIPAVNINAMVKAGDRYLEDKEAGWGTLAGEMLVEGTLDRTAREIATLVESAGGTLKAAGGYATTGVSLTLLSEDMPMGLELAAEMLRSPAFGVDRLGLATDRRLAELRAKQDDPRWVASAAFNEIVFEGTPQSRPPLGRNDTIARIVREDLVAYHRRFFAPNNALITVVGDFNTAEVAARVESLFGDWERDPGFALPFVPEPVRYQSPHSRFIHMEKEQVNIFLGHLGVRRNTPDYAVIRVLDTILGDSPGFTSRIPRVLRDEQGLAYTVYCDMARSAGIDPGRFAAYIGTAPENLDRAIKELREQIALMAERGPSDAEVAEAKAYLTGSSVFDYETNTQVAAFLSMAETCGLGFDEPQRYMEEVSRVTTRDVRRAAQEYIKPEALSLVVVGPVE